LGEGRGRASRSTGPEEKGKRNAVELKERSLAVFGERWRRARRCSISNNISTEKTPPRTSRGEHV